MKKEWKMNTSIHDNIIEISGDDKAEDGDEYCYYLYDINNSLVEKSKWIQDACYKFSVKEEGAYFVKIFRKRNNNQDIISTKYVDYYNKSTKLEFEKYCNEKMKYSLTNNLKPDFLYKMKYPYKDFAAIVSKDNRKVSCKFLSTYGFKKKVFEMSSYWVEILSDKIDIEDNGIIFSGLAKCRKVLVNGEDDLGINTEVNEDTIGNFTYLKKEEGRIEIGSDYFGTGKIYYYMKNEVTVVTNNYHLLLLILRDIGEMIQPNKELILALLCKSGQAFQQSISREREMQDVYMLPADKKLEIRKKGISIEDKNISLVFKMKKKKNIKRYDKLLKQGKNEILDNTEIILADQRYKKVIVDLTGGLDSRLVYGAVSNLENYRDKVVIHADGYDAAINQENSDLSIAVRVNSLNKYDYNTVYVEHVWRDIIEVENEMISQSVLSGYYYPHSYTKMAITRKDLEPAFEINGFYGEICCRPYYSRKLLQKEVPLKEISSLLPIIANRKGVLSGNSYNALKNKLQEELCLLPGNTPLEKWEIHYLFYRNGLHCNTIWEYEKRTPQWGPLQSKALFKYKHLTFGKMDGINEQLRLINAMNQRLNLIPFADPQDEIERIHFIKSFENEESTNPYQKEQIEGEKQRWLNRRIEKRLNSTHIGEDGRDFSEIKKEGEIYDGQFELRLLEILHKLMKYNDGAFKELFGIAVFTIIRKKSLSVNEMKTLYQKLVSVYVQIKIFNLL